MKLNVIFDLDGTLIDSSDSVLETLHVVIDQFGISHKPLTSKDLIGPPLDAVLRTIIGKEFLPKLPLLKEAFVKQYDTVGYKKALPYEGIEHAIKLIRQRSNKVCIATNKRLNPTIKMLKYFGWEDLFDHIVAVDSIDPPFTSKTEMLRYLISQKNLKQEATVYIGDLFSDYESSVAAGLYFLLATWGFGDPKSFDCLTDKQKVRKTSDLDASINFMNYV